MFASNSFEIAPPFSRGVGSADTVAAPYRRTLCVTSCLVRWSGRRPLASQAQLIAEHVCVVFVWHLPRGAIHVDIARKRGKENRVIPSSECP